MPKITVKIDKSLLDDALHYLIGKGLPNNLSQESIVEKSLSLLVYGLADHKKGKEILKQRLAEHGASIEDYLSGRIKTWARESKLLNEGPDPNVQRINRMEEIAREILNEFREKEIEMFYAGHDLYRNEPEEVDEPKLDTSIPPWQRMKLIEWDRILGLYPERNKNPLVSWAEKNEVSQYAVQAALAHMPPTEWTSPEALRLSKELYEKFKQWED